MGQVVIFEIWLLATSYWLIATWLMTVSENSEYHQILNIIELAK